MEENNHIGNERARAFVAALRSFEQDGNPSGLLDQFADGVTLSRFDGRGERTDANAFWQEYRAQFERVSTTFRNAVEGDGEVALEWDSDVVINGSPLRYSGVTVLGIEPRGDTVTSVRTYYDSAALMGGPRART